LLASKEEYLSFQQWLTEMSGDSTTLFYKNIESVVQLIKSSWEQGAFLTPKISIFGDATGKPNATHYTKPIVVLIDEVSGSGGDAFPSLMQGIGRAKLLGSTTMGLGGHVIELPPLYYSQVQPRMTRSLFYRPDGVPVENNGAVPDYAYVPTRDDFMYGYKLYQNFYTQKLLELVTSAATPKP
jgi:C-terminal processing protease CtpA/Prc